MIAELDIRAGRYACLEISDTGAGIEKKILERIFDPNFTTKAKGEGTGLGLSVVQGIVKTLHGDITVYNEPGKGTTFHVYLPVTEGHSVVLDDERLQRPLPRGNESVMVVDDEATIVQLIQRILEGLGYQVSIFGDSERALQKFVKTPEQFDLVVTDMTMPKLNGMQLSKEILTVRPDMKIIMCTGFSELISETSARSLGIKRFVSKPVTKRNLAEIVREVLDNP